MAKSQEFLGERRGHLVAKLEVTREATGREGLPLLPAARHYKETEHIPQIIAAIARIDNGTYGYCIDCEEEIPKKRLLRHPHVERCVPCQTIKEKNERR
ncbi:MAG: hypothetical protein A2937_00660 [Candidatus Yonathbacteria bacterium RIFCSPLOWO2_01_FULL_47_33b]|uniref:Zinc finger DksA/TraR C4-type domain-containing protein n=1 Tax=Candidatus Yonathbacteria bacterium RIFCSPLOWO2_01_FULL_47_33b TaxID=1802727 RepID=A0A1G2SET6_9BACT|nr:MAG: hypothetical protein A2937_00660 [Candidatus Yonathbacteria bacterium RIFCSPLOWO2_01_FULL_47_33b]